MPAFSIIFGDLLDTLNDEEELKEEIDDVALTFFVVGCIAFVASLGEITFMNISAANQITIVRRKYFQSVLRQDIGWFDSTSSGDLSTRLAENTIALNHGMGNKLGNLAHNASTFFGGIIVGFIVSWKMSLVVIAFLPFMGAAVWFMAEMGNKYEKLLKDSYAAAGVVAEESLTNLSTVTALNTQNAEHAKYASHLHDAQVAAVKKGRGQGQSQGSIYGLMFVLYGVGLWFGGTLVVDSIRDDNNCIANPDAGDCFTGGDVMLVFFALVMSAFSVGQVGPAFNAFSAARAAGARIFAIIDRKPVVDSMSPDGTKLTTVSGQMSFKNITFKYPSRPKQLILNDFSLEVAAGETVAFVGESGSGKSTLMALMERYYDPLDGSIQLDGHDLKTLNVANLRSHIGLVSQEPTLFDDTIRNNIALGLPAEDVAIERIHEAARMANAHDFIMQLPEGYETRVGERGTQLSGGQKQRVAIARAILRKPRVLLLDEATSALDTRSERIVQAALDTLVREGGSSQTTFMIAHRLSTVTGVDRIVVLDHGSIVEMGSPSELLANPDGYFSKMLAMQQLTEDGAEEEATEGGVEEPGAASPKVAAGGRASRGDSVAAEVEAGAEAGAEAPKAGCCGRKKKPAAKKELGEDEVEVGFMDVWRFQKGNYHILALGMFTAAINGTLMPLFSVIFARILAVFFQEVNNADGSVNVEATIDEIEDDTLLMMVYFIVLGVVSAVTMLVQPWMFSIAGERLTTRLRSEAFASLLKQEPAYFDAPKHNVGALAARLSTDATLIQHTTGQKLGLTIQNNVALIAALVISFVASWRLTLVVLGTMPFMAMAGMAMMAFVMGEGKDTTFTQAAATASEAFSGIRTVTAFGMQAHMEKRYLERLGSGSKVAIRQHWMGGIFFGLSQLVMFATYSLCFWAGAQFIDEGYITLEELLRVFFALSMASWSVGENAQNAVDQTKAEAAKRSVFAIIRRESQIDPTSTEGTTPATCKGGIEFKDVGFRYPTRPNHVVLKKVSFSVAPGSVVAFVGASGCGKSTIMRLLQRMYNPEDGSITLDGTPIHELNLRWLRAQCGIVQQEPALFADTLHYNIAYGRDDVRPKPCNPKAPATKETDLMVPSQVVEAARGANATSFIESFPDQYGTRAGAGGNQLSGGQKQRIAIARALVNNPKILMLDEATSALDSESERIVQEAFDRLMEENRGQRTTLVIAHRLSTIRSADVIVVMHRGEVVEMGDHASLLSNPDGRYSMMVRAQGTAPAS